MPASNGELCIPCGPMLCSTVGVLLHDNFFKAEGTVIFSQGDKENIHFELKLEQLGVSDQGRRDLGTTNWDQRTKSHSKSENAFDELAIYKYTACS
jgi:hypothetical protein